MFFFRANRGGCWASYEFLQYPGNPSFGNEVLDFFKQIYCFSLWMVIWWMGFPVHKPPIFLGCRSGTSKKKGCWTEIRLMWFLPISVDGRDSPAANPTCYNHEAVWKNGGKMLQASTGAGFLFHQQSVILLNLLRFLGWKVEHRRESSPRFFLSEEVTGVSIVDAEVTSFLNIPKTCGLVNWTKNRFRRFPSRIFRLIQKKDNFGPMPKILNYLTTLSSMFFYSFYRYYIKIV